MKKFWTKPSLWTARTHYCPHMALNGNFNNFQFIHAFITFVFFHDAHKNYKHNHSPLSDLIYVKKKDHSKHLSQCRCSYTVQLIIVVLNVNPYSRFEH